MSLELVTRDGVTTAPAGERKDGLVPARPLTEQEIALVARLRAEANTTKELFSKQAFQALGISSVALGGLLYLLFYDPSGKGIVTHGPETVLVGLAAMPILAFLLTTCRLGTFAFGSANRHFGYELFLYRVRTIPLEKMGRWREEYRSIEWEAAMRAWRVVEPTLYRRIYKIGGRWFRYITAHRYRRDFDPKRNPQWFSQASLFAKYSDSRLNANWHAGDFLSRVQRMLFLAAAAAEAILMVAIGREVGNKSEVVLLGVCVAAMLLGFFFLVSRWRAERARRQIMEDGLASIHSCSILWQAAVLAHFQAARRAHDCGVSSWVLEKLSRDARRKYKKEWRLWQEGKLRFEEIVKLARAELPETRATDDAGLVGYTFWLGEEATSLARHAHDVPAWLSRDHEDLVAANHGLP